MRSHAGPQAGPHTAVTACCRALPVTFRVVLLPSLPRGCVYAPAVAEPRLLRRAFPNSTLSPGDALSVLAALVQVVVDNRDTIEGVIPTGDLSVLCDGIERLGLDLPTQCETPLRPARAHTLTQLLRAQRVYDRRYLGCCDAPSRPSDAPAPCHSTKWGCHAFFKQKTAYGIMSGDWSSDVCSSD
eukprot:COSAG02_NODE_18366_length_943_cov_1.303318_1_plen_184_part_01